MLYLYVMHYHAGTWKREHNDIFLCASVVNAFNFNSYNKKTDIKIPAFMR